MRTWFRPGLILLVFLATSASPQEAVRLLSRVHDEVYWRLRALQIDERYDAEISKLRAETGRLITRRFDFGPEVFEEIDVTPPPNGIGLPPEVLSLRERIRDAEKERAEAREKLREEAFREGALPGWFRPPEPEIMSQVARAEEEEREAARREAKAQREQEAHAPHNEKYWRKRFAELRSRISTLETERSRRQRELKQTFMGRLDAIPQVVYASDFFYMPMLTESQNHLGENEEELHKAQQELEDAEVELRRAGGLPAWARE